MPEAVLLVQEFLLVELVPLVELAPVVELAGVVLAEAAFPHWAALVLLEEV